MQDDINFCTVVTNIGLIFIRPYAWLVDSMFYNRKPNQKKLAFESFAPSKDTPPPVPKSKDEEFLLPSTKYPFYGVFAGPDGAAKTAYIRNLMQSHQNLPINYGQVPWNGTCQEKLRSVLCDMFQMKPFRPRPEILDNILGPEPLREGLATLGMLSAVQRAAEKYGRADQKNTLKPVAILDKFENLDGCDSEIEYLLNTAHQVAKKDKMSFIFVEDGERIEKKVSSSDFYFRKHTFGNSTPPNSSN